MPAGSFIVSKSLFAASLSRDGRLELYENLSLPRCFCRYGTIAAISGWNVDGATGLHSFNNRFHYPQITQPLLTRRDDF